MVAMAAVAVMVVSATALPTMPAHAGLAEPGPAPDAFTALQRDFGLTADQARSRLSKEDDATRTESVLRKELGAAYAGAWLTPEGRLVVATTDAAYLGRIRHAGAEARLVARSQAELDAVKAKLDKDPRMAHSPIVSWYVDVPRNEVVVTALVTGVEAVRHLVAGIVADPGVVRVEKATGHPLPTYEVRGGDAFGSPTGGCSIGFAVWYGYVTAGHCGSQGSLVNGYNGVSQGVMRVSSFPGNDYAYVEVYTNWATTPLVNRYDGATVTVTGSREAPIGASVCRSGRTTGWQCGTILALNESVNYSWQGGIVTVHGLTRTTACAYFGDSGGSFVWGTEAQGTVSGGIVSPTCPNPDTLTWFQPVNEILSAYGLVLVTPNTPQWPFDDGPTVYSDGPGDAHVFSRGANGHLVQHYYTTGGWRFQDLGGNPSTGSVPGGYTVGPGDGHVFVRSMDNEMWHYYWTSTGWKSAKLGGGVTSGPAVYSNGPGDAHVYFRDTNGQLQKYLYAGNQWWSQQIGGSIANYSAPAAYTNGVDPTTGQDRAHVFVRSPDARLWHHYWTSSGWRAQDIGGPIYTSPAVYSAGVGDAHVFARGPGNHLVQYYYTTSGWSYQDLGGSVVSPPAAYSTGPGDGHVLVRSADNHLWHHYWTTTGWKSEDLGGSVASQPAVYSDGPGSAHVFFSSFNGHVWHYYQTPTGWQAHDLDA
jgi:streptogrisin C